MNFRIRILAFALAAMSIWTSVSALADNSMGSKVNVFVPPRRWALVIGASRYQSIGALKYASADAKLFANTLKETFQYQPETVELLTDDPDSGKTPDAKSITAALDRQIADKRLDKGDLFIFYFAGHGVGTPEGDMLLPTDATTQNAAKVGLPVKAVLDRFVKAGLKNVVVIADACRAGEKNTFGAELQALGKQANIAVLLGCSPGARSYEYPQLGHGVFTSFLAKALKSKTLRSPLTGALWTSKVAEEVQSKVLDYTARGYPESPQKPSILTEKSQDVLLGAFESSVDDPAAVRAIQKESEGLSQDKKCDALTLFASDLYSSHKVEESIEVFKVLDQLDALTPMNRYLYSLALRERGRYAEAVREYDKIQKSDAQPLIRELVTAFNPSRLIAPDVRLQAAEKAWDMEPAEWVGFVVWASCQMYGSKADANAILEKLLASDVLSPRARKFFEGIQAANAGNWRAALASYDSCEKIEGDTPGVDLIDAYRFIGLTFLGDTDAVVALLRKNGEDPQNGTKSLLTLAEYYKEQGQADLMMATVKAALANNPEPDDLLWALRIVALRYPEIMPVLKEKAALYPFAWKAAVAKLWANADQGSGSVQASIDEALKFCDDEFTVMFEYLRLLDEQLDEMLAKGLIAKDFYLQTQVAYSSIMAENVDEFGYDPYAWLLLNKFGLMSEKYEQVLALYNLKLGALADRGSLEPMLRAPYFYAAVCMGDEKRTEQLWKLQGFHPADIRDCALVRSISFALRGQIAEAKAAMPAQLPSPVFRPALKALRAYIDVREGKPADLESLVAGAQKEPAALQILALAYVAKKDWKHAEPLLKKVAFERQLIFTFVQARTVKTLFDRYVSTKRIKEANEIAYTVMTSAYGNPLYREIGFDGPPDVKKFVGTIQMDTGAFDLLPDIVRGHIKLTFTSAGAVSGSGAMGDYPLSVTGKIDGYGNLQATLKAHDRVWRMTGKVAPPHLYKELPQFQSLGQIFLLLEPNGQALFYMCQPSKQKTAPPKKRGL